MQAAAARRQAAEAQKRHLAEQMAMNYGPGVYIPTAEEAAAIERRNWLTLGGLLSGGATVYNVLCGGEGSLKPAAPPHPSAGTLLAAVGGAYYTFWQRNKTQVGHTGHPGCRSQSVAFVLQSVGLPISTPLALGRHN